MELVSAMAEKSGLSKKDCEDVLGALTDTLTEAMKAGGKVQLVGLASFEVKKRAARTDRNPRTNEPVEIPAAKLPVFKLGKALKDAIQ